MISNREPVGATGMVVRAIVAATSLLTIGAFVGCGQGRTNGGGKPGSMTPDQSSGASGSSGGGGVTGAAGGGVVVVSGDAGAGGTSVVPPSAGAGGSSVVTPPDGTGTTTPDPSCATASTPGAAPPVYVSECSSCHGMTADGRTGYPTLRRADMTLDQMKAIVRAGKTSATMEVTAQGKMTPYKMPAFSTARLTDADIATIFAYRSLPKQDNAPVPAVHCLTRPEASWTPDQINEAYSRGLKAWRTPGDVDNNACVSCHAADAMDLAFIGYTDSQIYRRAFSHINVNQQTIDDVIDMVHALRAKYNIVQPPNPATYRPFQPGGAVLPGGSALERDKAFGDELKAMGLRLMGDPINSVADAKKAWDELAAIDLRKLKVGIPMNHYTEDKFNNDGVNVPCPDKHMCDDHGTIADWMTDTAVLPGNLPAAVLAAEDAYLANPTLDTLKAALLTLPRDETSWFKHKYGSVMIANFLFRLQAQGDSDLSKFTAANPVPFPVDAKTGMLFNTIWMVGANQRDFIHNVGAALPTGGGKFSVPAETLPGLTRNDASEQLQRIIVPWFWLGFSFDPSTMNVEPDYVAEGDEYFTQETFLDNGSSPIHGAFIVSKRSVEVMKYQTLPRSPNVFPFFHPDLGRFPVTPMVMRSGYFPIVTNFAEEKNFNTVNNYQIKFTPTEPAHKALYQTYAANQWRMFMWTLIGELQQTPSIWNQNILNGKINKAEIFLKQPEVAATNGTQDAAMIAMARDLVGKASVTK
ncbi:MAG TPA: cytochrome c [Polyangia bacterium]|nr:cytochrome c [Polyangia bacterium]